MKGKPLKINPEHEPLLEEIEFGNIEFVKAGLLKFGVDIYRNALIYSVLYDKKSIQLDYKEQSKHKFIKIKTDILHRTLLRKKTI